MQDFAVFDRKLMLKGGKSSGAISSISVMEDKLRDPGKKGHRESTPSIKMQGDQEFQRCNFQKGGERVITPEEGDYSFSKKAYDEPNTSHEAGCKASSWTEWYKLRA